MDKMTKVAIQILYRQGVLRGKKALLPVDVHRSKTPLLKLPNNQASERKTLLAG